MAPFTDIQPSRETVKNLLSALISRVTARPISICLCFVWNPEVLYVPGLPYVFVSLKHFAP